VDSVLRRAADLGARDEGPDRVGGRALTADGDPSLTEAEVMRLGTEAGLRSDRLATALAELRRGALAGTTDADDSVGHALGPSHFVVSRVVPGSAEAARRAVERFLRDQLMTVRRHHGDRVEWERAAGIWPDLLRSLDFSKRYGFALVDGVETTVFEDRGETVITFHLDVAKTRRKRLLAMGARALAAFTLFGLGGAALAPGFGAADLLALGVGGLAAGGVAALERRRYLESRSRVLLAPERFLDLYVQRRQPTERTGY